MPNWVYNQVHVHGPDDQLVKFKEAVADGDCPFGFNKILPMPKSLNLVDGTSTDMAIVAALTEKCSDNEVVYVKAFVRRELRNNNCPASLCDESYFSRTFDKLVALKAAEDAETSRGVIYDASTNPKTYREYVEWGKVYLSNLRNYGVATWYNWSNLNWGTKWDACECEFVDYVDTYLYNFSTAWSTPDGIINYLPTFLNKIGAEDVTIDWRWAEEQGYYAGRYLVSVNDVKSEYFENSDEAYALCEEIMGYSARDDEDDEEDQ